MATLLVTVVKHISEKVYQGNINGSNLRVVLVVLAVVLIVEVLGLLLGLVLGLLAVEEVEALGLEELVDLGAGNASKSLLGEGVLDGLACCIGSVW